MTGAAQSMIANWKVGETRDIHAETTRLTMEIAAQAFLGTSVVDKCDRVGRAMQTVIEHFANILILVPGHSWLPTPGNLRFRRACRELDAVIYETIACVARRAVRMAMTCFRVCWLPGTKTAAR